MGAEFSENPRGTPEAIDAKKAAYKSACARLRKKLCCVIEEKEMNSRSPPIYGHEHDWDTYEEGVAEAF